MEYFVRQRKWDLRFLEAARFFASWSKDPSTQTGAIIVDTDDRIVSTGYNGFARGVCDSPERLSTRDLKYKMIVHCERNAIIFARQDLRGCRLYTWPFMSCAACAAMVIQAGIKETIAPPSSNPRWQEDFTIALEMFKEAGVNHRFVGEEHQVRIYGFMSVGDLPGGQMKWGCTANDNMCGGAAVDGCPECYVAHCTQHSGQEHDDDCSRRAGHKAAECLT